MWTDLSQTQKTEYKKMMLAFASLTEMFAQKSDAKQHEVIVPFINSKYQETVFQRVFNAFAEDISNTPYDASLQTCNADGTQNKYLVGIKTFRFDSGAQKVAQFKKRHNDWAGIINQIKNNSRNHTKDEINSINKELYRELAIKIATIRNMRIESSEAKIQGFSIIEGKDTVIRVYHVLMTSKHNNTPRIYVGETSYDKIDIEKIQVNGCTNKNSPTNFTFEDGKHKYRFTSADSQLLMYFNNREIVKDHWDVQYANDAYAIFADIANRINNEEDSKIVESYSWKIDVQPYSGFNSFYAVSSKMTLGAKETRIKRLKEKYKTLLDRTAFEKIFSDIESFILTTAVSDIQRTKKVVQRNKLVEYVKSIGNEDLLTDILKIVYRPKDEIYIPLQYSTSFHLNHKDFFAPSAGNYISSPKLLKEKSKFMLVLDPSGEEIECYISQSNGKAIMSYGKQSILGEWLLRHVFQLNEYEPLTQKRLEELEINGMRLYKKPDGKVHLQFIYIEDNNLPDDFVRQEK